MNELWMYGVRITYWNEDCKKKKVKFMVAAGSMTEAVEKVCDYYGDDRIENISAVIIDDTQYGMILIDEVDA